MGGDDDDLSDDEFEFILGHSWLVLRPFFRSYNAEIGHKVYNFRCGYKM